MDLFRRVRYATFSIHGLISEFGKENVTFSSQYFKELIRDEESYFLCIALLIVSPNSSVTRIIIDYQVKPAVVESAYEWSDIYAKININKDLTESLFLTK